MTPDVGAWAAQIPWLPLVAVVAALVVWTLASGGGKKKRAALAAKIAEGALVVDVRSPSEFSSGHYPGAVNHPVDRLEASLKKLGDKDRSLVVHCASGARSARAAQVQRAAGFTDVTDAGDMANLPR